MTEQEKADVQELLDALPRCHTYGGEGPNGWGEQCKEVAVMSHPTAVLGDWMLKCAKHHPGETQENEFGDKPHSTRWAAVVARYLPETSFSALQLLGAVHLLRSRGP